jgi:hypothetical protein
MNKFITSLIIIGILLLTFRVIIDTVSASYHTIEYWDGSTNTDVMIYGNNWRGETFTLGTTGQNVGYELTSVRLSLWKAGTPNGYSVRIRATSSGLPTGGDLSIAWFNGNDLTTSAAWYNLSIPHITLTSSTTYAIIVSCNGSSTGNCLKVRLRNAGEDYAGGGALYSTNAGVSFTLGATNSIPFYAWGTYAITSFNISYSNFSIVNNSYINKTIDYNEISHYYNKTITHYVNVSFNKNCTEGYDTTTTLYCNGINLGSKQWINGSRTYNILTNLNSMINGNSYKIFFNTTYLDLLYVEFYNIVFNITVINLPTINSTCGNTSLTVYNNTVNTTGKYESVYSSLTGWKLWMNYTGLKTSCDNTSLTVYNNTVNTTGKYETSYNSSTGNKIWLNFTGLGGGNITGYVEADLFLVGYITFILSFTSFLIIRKRRKNNGL